MSRDGHSLTFSGEGGDNSLSNRVGVGSIHTECALEILPLAGSLPV